MTRGIATMIALGAAALLAGCATEPGADASGEPARRKPSEHGGVVESVREVQIERAGSGIGGVVGAVIGGVAGSNVGQGSGAVIGSVLGSVLGGVAGQAAEQAATHRPGYEITVRLDDGQRIAVTQGTDESFSPGDRVRILSDGITARVTK
jgi:outer membrane lipoprotein SlyB